MNESQSSNPAPCRSWIDGDEVHPGDIVVFDATEGRARVQHNGWGCADAAE